MKQIDRFNEKFGVDYTIEEAAIRLLINHMHPSVKESPEKLYQYFIEYYKKAKTHLESEVTE